ncbi:putative FKBP-type peptidyl-prolyl cis-trans isomerase FkpA [Polaribacter huanghezhanensis]|uniref:FKBP-type peptidyl-prolyl cis-trans isomerase n=1 Tax=Polaribacter huanghezhanensis TaxID=1354726 RepID=UPI00264802F4|nr:FKBP-type peptidyl-prolyl cis-trans isomerase [Polaribacter huanghezhanensis]WKD86379.1 putative FKBP-type peptidyl-prolyl cis-trans isomerase FkpA [Polaribacter huanghezhanensis]
MKIVKTLALLILTIGLVSCNPKYKTKKLDSKLDSVSYALGVDLAIKIKTSFGKIDTDLFVQGYLNATDSSGLLLKKQDLNIINKYIQQKRIEKTNREQQKSKAEVEKKFGSVKKLGEEFLAYNKKKAGIITTKSGLQYKIIKEGKGKKPTAMSTVKVHYTGELINGTVFESSRSNKKPSEFKVYEVIKGWTEGLQLMREGAKYRFFIPQELAYGSMYKSKLIQPFTALIFDLELIEIVKK